MSMLIYDTLIKSDDKVFVAKTNYCWIPYWECRGQYNGFYYFAWSSIFKGKKLVYELLEDDIIVAEGANRNRIYKLKR